MLKKTAKAAEKAVASKPAAKATAPKASTKAPAKPAAAKPAPSKPTVAAKVVKAPVAPVRAEEPKKAHWLDPQEKARLVATLEAEAAENAVREMSSRPRGLIRFAVPMSFGLRWVAPLLPDFFRLYPEISIDLHLSDATVDLVGDGFDAALRIAVLPDSSLVARRLCEVSPVVLAAPGYLARHGEPRHPRELNGHHCLGYAYRRRQDIWHFTNSAG